MEPPLTVVFEEFRGKRLLVVEPGHALADAIRRQLQASGAVVISPVRFARQALLLIDQRDVDAVIMDISLDAETMLAITEALDARTIPYVFATEFEPDLLPRRFRGYVVGSLEGIQAIAQRLFGERPH
jgi:CheY-like chemotaxis protein